MASMQLVRFSFPSITDQQAALWITSIICPIYSVILLGVRYALRRDIKKSDVTLGGGYVLAVIEWAFIWAALLNGVGKSTTVISATAFTSASRFVYGSVVVALLVIAATTASQCFFVSELTFNPRHLRICFRAASACVILVLAALLVLLAGCSSTRYLYHEGSPEAACHAQSNRWIIGGILLGLATCAPATLPPILLYDLQVSRRRKASIYAMFGTTLLSVPLIVLMVIYFIIFNRGNQDSITAVRFLIFLQILLVWCLASATIPCMRPVALKFKTSRAQLQDASLYGAGSKAASTACAVPRGVLHKAEDQSRQYTGSNHAMTPSNSRSISRDGLLMHSLDDISINEEHEYGNRAQETSLPAFPALGSKRQFTHKTMAVTVAKR